MLRTARRVLFAAAVALIAERPASAQLKAGPPSGDNQRSAVSQWIGPVEVTIRYSSPNVHAPDGSDRRGQVWGKLVPWGMAELGFGTCGKECPWRMGANENTVFTVSHDVTIEGKPLPAGEYGLHALPGESEWTLIFSKESDAWGSFFYDAKHDALRVTVKPAKSAYREWLAYEFTDRQPDRATVQLTWEELAVPFTVAVPNVNELHFAEIRRELEGSTGFTWNSWLTGIQFCLQNNFHLEEAEAWARYAIDGVFVGQENFQTLATLSQVLAARGKADEAKAALDRAVNHRSTSPGDIHGAARQLQAQGKSAEAIAMFELNAKRFPGEWPTEVGLMRAWAAKGDQKKAIEHARKARAQAPDAGNQQNLDRMIARLEKGDLAIN